MNGQWVGRYTGTNSGLLVIDLDDIGTHYEGIACAYDDDTSLPSTCVFIKTTDKSNPFNGRVDLLLIDPRSGEPTTWDKISSLFESDTIVPEYADVRLDLSGDTLNVTWETNINTSGYAEIARTKADTPTEYQPLPEVKSWEQFKVYVNNLEHRRYIFRGQSQPLRLRTSFHRTGRAALPRFLKNDIRTLHRHLSLRTSHVFNLSIPDENGAFFNLVQHHGYPTPLLDWTFSPFVAAFFAYHRLKNSEAYSAVEDKIRIFIFDQKEWQETFPQFVHLTWRKPHFSIMEFIAIDNERMTPQQSISSVTNVDDIETYIRSMENTEKQFLRIVDLPKNERPSIMKELSVMGITAGSLFPGLDGACEELRERFFDL
jgi:FRG domain